MKLWRQLLALGGAFATLLGLEACSDRDIPAALGFSIVLPASAPPAPAPMVTTQDGSPLYDLSREGIIGKLTVAGDDIDTLERLFPQDEDKTWVDGTTEENIIVLEDIEVTAGGPRRIDGVFFMHEEDRVVAFASETPLEVTLEPGERLEVTLALLEAETGALTLLLASPDPRFVRAYPVEAALGVVFPPAELEDDGQTFFFDVIPLGYDFWFRLEDADGNFYDFSDAPLCTTSDIACTLSL